MEPLLRWPGGKRRLAARIVSLLPKRYNRYFEPFVGAGAVFYQLGPRFATLGDLNTDLMNFYEQVKLVPTAVAGVIAARGDAITEEQYYELREEFNSCTSAVDRAAIFMILNMTCFNGIWRVNKYGQFNVPFGGRGNLVRVSADHLNRLSTLLAHVSLFRGDFEECVADATAGDLIYLDPPYPPISANETFIRYTDVWFDIDRQKDVARVFSTLTDQGCFVAVSLPDTPLIQELFTGSRKYIVEASRSIRARGCHLKVNEVVILNY